jgi:hypothetical protein
MRARITGNYGLENAKEKGPVIQALIKNEEIIKVRDKFYWTDRCVNWVKRCAEQLRQ